MEASYEHSIYSLIFRINHVHQVISISRGDGAVGWSVVPASGRLAVRIPAATDLSRKNR